MAKYRKKPVVIEAEQYFTGKQIDGVVYRSGPCYTQQETNCDGTISHRGGPDIKVAVVPTLEGEMHVSDGDWIITGVKGEKYPCKPDIFEATYEDASLPVASAEGWMEIAAQHARNEEYYRGLVVEIGKMCGEQAYIADDGSRSDSVLCAKVPALVKELVGGK